MVDKNCSKQHASEYGVEIKMTTRTRIRSWCLLIQPTNRVCFQGEPDGALSHNRGKSRWKQATQQAWQSRQLSMTRHNAHWVFFTLLQYRYLSSKTRPKTTCLPSWADFDTVPSGLWDPLNIPDRTWSIQTSYVLRPKSTHYCLSLWSVVFFWYMLP